MDSIQTPQKMKNLCLFEHFILKDTCFPGSMGVGAQTSENAVTQSSWKHVILLFCLNHINVPVQHMQAIQGQTEAC